MPLRHLQKALQGKIDIKNALTQAAQIFEAYVWSPSNLSSGQYGGDYIKLTDTKATTVQGGASAAGLQTRALNAEDSDTGGHCTLASNQFTLAAGTYRISATAPCYNGDRHKAQLYNVTDAAIILLGSPEYTYTLGSSVIQSRSIINGEFAITANKTFSIRHFVQTAQTTNGFGVSANDGNNEIYTIVELWKVK